MKLFVPMLMSLVWTFMAAGMLVYGEVTLLERFFPELGLVTASLIAALVTALSIVAVFKTWARVLTRSENARANRASFDGMANTITANW